MLPLPLVPLALFVASFVFYRIGKKYEWERDQSLTDDEFRTALRNMNKCVSACFVTFVGGVAIGLALLGM